MPQRGPFLPLSRTSSFKRSKLALFSLRSGNFEWVENPSRESTSRRDLDESLEENQGHCRFSRDLSRTLCFSDLLLHYRQHRNPQRNSPTPTVGVRLARRHDHQAATDDGNQYITLPEEPFGFKTSTSTDIIDIIDQLICTGRHDLRIRTIHCKCTPARISASRRE